MTPFHYLVIIDRKQCGQTLFLKALSRDLAKQNRLRGIFIHGDNERTEQLLQEGIMREAARKRVTKETSKRLVDVFAESGISCVSLELSQVISKTSKGTTAVDDSLPKRIPGRTHLILSNLIDDGGRIVDLELMAKNLAEVLEIPILKINHADIHGIFVEKGDQNTYDLDVNESNIQHLSIQDWSRFEEIYPS